MRKYVSMKCVSLRLAQGDGMCASCVLVPSWENSVSCVAASGDDREPKAEREGDAVVVHALPLAERLRTGRRQSRRRSGTAQHESSVYQKAAPLHSLNQACSGARSRLNNTTK